MQKTTYFTNTLISKYKSKKIELIRYCEIIIYFHQNLFKYGLVFRAYTVVFNFIQPHRDFFKSGFQLLSSLCERNNV